MRSGLNEPGTNPLSFDFRFSGTEPEGCTRNPRNLSSTQRKRKYLIDQPA